MGRKALDFLIAALIIFMMALVGYVGYVVCSQHREAQHARNTIDDVIEKIENADTSQVQGYVSISKEDLKSIVEARVSDNSDIMDINSFISIMLTLITLCLTCSAIIPYVVAKFISEAKIKDTVEDIYARDKERTDKQYYQSVEKLEVAEAHLSRMVAYNLMKMDGIRKELTHGVTTDGYDYSVHAVWTIGWASKALFRYIRNVDSNSARPDEVKKFCKNCITYIEQSADMLVSSLESDDAKEKALRAVCDILDVILYYKSPGKNKSVSAIIESSDIDKLSKCARTLYQCIEKEPMSESMLLRLMSKFDLIPNSSDKWPSKENFKAILNKSKYKEYLKDDDGNVASVELFRRKVVEVLAY